jgi:hypothetical protein
VAGLGESDLSYRYRNAGTTAEVILVEEDTTSQAEMIIRDMGVCFDDQDSLASGLLTVDAQMRQSLSPAVPRPVASRASAILQLARRETSNRTSQPKHHKR